MSNRQLSQLGDPLIESDYRAHLLGFADAFIDKKYRKRWRHVLLEQPEKASGELKRFERHFEARYCKLLEEVELRSREFAEWCGKADGIFFDGRSTPIRIRYSSAVERAQGPAGGDALFSIEPGRRAVFFFHEGYGWKCER